MTSKVFHASQKEGGRRGRKEKNRKGGGEADVEGIQFVRNLVGVFVLFAPIRLHINI